MTVFGCPLSGMFIAALGILTFGLVRRGARDNGFGR